MEIVPHRRQIDLNLFFLIDFNYLCWIDVNTFWGYISETCSNRFDAEGDPACVRMHYSCQSQLLDAASKVLLSLWMSLYTYIYIYIYICNMYTHIHMRTRIHIHIRMYIYVYAYVYIYIYT